jgi:hypothetical protein
MPAWSGVSREADRERARAMEVHFEDGVFAGFRLE